MLRAISVLIAALLAVCFSAGAPAVAADYCITLGAPFAATYVGKNFTVPKAGECADWVGECTVGCSPDNVQSGVACTASNGSHVSLGITIFYLADNREFTWIRLDLPAATGSGNTNYLEPTNPPNLTQNFPAKGASCPAQSLR